MAKLEKHEDEERAQYTNMVYSKQSDWDIIKKHSGPFSAQLADRVLAHLRLLDGDFGGFPVDRLTHCIQTAQLAEEDGKDEEYIVMALLHDIGWSLGG
jgi:predicted HD phosphohydrolase